MNPSTRFIAAAASCLFILLGLAIIPYAGVQTDESVFASPVYLYMNKEFRARLFHHDIPLMVMSYIGTLKTLLYWPIFAWLGANVWTLRFPMVLAGAATVFIFFLLATRAAGPRAAIIGLALLATDPLFLMTDTIDWGPVAIEHLLLVTGCFFLVRFAQPRVFEDTPISQNEPISKIRDASQVDRLSTRNVSPSHVDLWAGFFFLGLALWNKAIFLWALAGLTLGVGLIFWRELRELFQWKRAAIAAGAFALGALPFLIYNLRHPNATLKGNAAISTQELSGKFLQLRLSLGGESLFGFIAGEDFLDHPKNLTTLRGRASGWIRNHLGEHRVNGMVYACGALLLAVPLWWRSRAARFSVVFCAVAWAAMALTRDAGGAAHHAVLLWPFPQLFVAATLAAIPWRLPWKGIAIVGTGVLAAMNLLVVNQYIYQLELNGADASFSDALFALSDAIPEKPDQRIYILDWGMINSLALLHRGRLTLRVANDAFLTDTPSAAEQRSIAYMLKDRDALFVDHVPEREVFKGVGKRAGEAAERAGLRKDLLGTYADTNGRPVFELFRLIPVNAPP